MRSLTTRAFSKGALICISAAALTYAAGCGFQSSSPGFAPFKPTAGASNIASGPILGYWWDTTAKGVRPIVGVAGASYQGPVLYGGGTYSAAAICARHSLALLTATTGSLYLANLPSGQPLQLTKEAAGKRLIVFSPSCSSAVEYAADGSSALLIRSLLSVPQPTSIQLPGSGTILGAAVADSGAVLTATARADGMVDIRMLPAGGGSAAVVTTLTQFGGLAFLPNADTALLADAGKNVVLSASQVGSNLSLTQIASAADGVSQPLAIAASADGLSAVIANQTKSTLLRISLSGSPSAAKVLCQCSPTKLEPLSGNAVFRLNEPGPDTVWAFDGDGATSRIVFLPADRQAPVAGVTK